MVTKANAEDDLSETRPGQALGTPGYLAPEQALGDPDVGPEADVYALGITLFELLAGRLPFVAGGGTDAQSAVSMMTQHATRPLPDILGADVELWLDGGHNPAAGDMLADTLAAFEEKAPKPVYLVVGMMGQKDALGFLAPFRGLVRGVYTVPVPGAYEAPHSQEKLAEVALSAGLQAIDRSGVVDALQTIAAQPKGPKRVLICGSLYLAGHVLTLQEQGI